MLNATRHSLEKLNGTPFFLQVTKRLCDLGEVLDEATIESNVTQEASNSFY